MSEQPGNVFTLGEAEAFTRIAKASISENEWEAFHSWCEAHAYQLARAVTAWTQLEELMRRCCIDELTYYNTPGVFSLRVSHAQGLNGFDLQGIDYFEEWDGKTLDACIGAVLQDILSVEESEKCE